MQRTRELSWRSISLFYLHGTSKTSNNSPSPPSSQWSILKTWQILLLSTWVSGLMKETNLHWVDKKQPKWFPCSKFSTEGSANLTKPNTQAYSHPSSDCKKWTVAKFHKWGKKLANQWSTMICWQKVVSRMRLYQLALRSTPSSLKSAHLLHCLVFLAPSFDWGWGGLTWYGRDEDVGRPEVIVVLVDAQREAGALVAHHPIVWLGAQLENKFIHIYFVSSTPHLLTTPDFYWQPKVLIDKRFVTCETFGQTDEDLTD